MLLISDITGIRASKVFGPSQIPSLEGKVFLVTGGHGGIGLATTRDLALAGAKVYIASRTPSKVHAAIAELVAAHPSLQGRLEFLQLDLASLKGTKEAAEEFLRRETRLDGLVANAGVMAVPYELTEDGVETQFQVNHLAHWLLAVKLAPLMEKTGELTGHPSRLVNLSSFAHNFFSLYPFSSPDFTSLAAVNRKYDGSGYIRYSQAKLSGILFSREFNKRFGKNVRSLSVHPGFVASDLYAAQPMMKPFLSTFITIDEGAISSLYAATSPEVEEKDLWGSYLVPFAKVKQTTAYGNSEKLAKDLWELSEAIVTDKIGGI